MAISFRTHIASPFFFAIALMLILQSGPSLHAGPVGWGIGETAPDFNALYLEQPSGTETPINFYSEAGADVYVLSLCAMWCGPCQNFAVDSGAIVSNMQSQGINAQLYDLIFEDPLSQDPDAADAQAWLDIFWTAETDNVWYGVDIPLSSPNSVVEDIVISSGNASSFGVPFIVFLDENFVVQSYLQGYGQSVVETRIVDIAASSSSVPEPTSALLLLAGGSMVFLTRRLRRKQQD